MDRARGSLSKRSMYRCPDNSCVFGGSNQDKLYITTAKVDSGRWTKERPMQAGSLSSSRIRGAFLRPFAGNRAGRLARWPISRYHKVSMIPSISSPFRICRIRPYFPSGDETMVARR